MPKFNLLVDNPNPNGDSVEKEFEWPVVPRKGEVLNIAPKGYTGSFAVVALQKVDPKGSLLA